MRKLSVRSSVLSLLVSLIPSLAAAQDPPAAAAAPAAEAAPATTTAAPPAPEAKKKHGGGPGLSLDPNAPQQGAPVIPIEVVVPQQEESGSTEWKFDVTGYFRAPLRMSWGPPTKADPSAPGVDAGTQFRTPPL